MSDLCLKKKRVLIGINDIFDMLNEQDVKDFENLLIEKIENVKDRFEFSIPQNNIK